MKNITIAIASGKGGTGKTLISVNMFYALNQLYDSVTLVDCDAEEPNDLLFFSQTQLKQVSQTEVNLSIPVINDKLCTFCGLCQEYCTYNAIFILKDLKRISVLEDLCHGCGACTFACKYGAIKEREVSLGEVTTYKVFENSYLVEARGRVGVYSPVNVIKAATTIGQRGGIVLLDSPPGTSCPFIQTVAKADYVILVTEPTPFGLSDLKQSAETLKTMGKPFGVIVNRAGLGDDEVYSYLKNENVPLLMEIPFEREIASIYSRGEIVAKTRPGWVDDFGEMFGLIYKDYGDSGNKR
ncbi:MAG: ATP-binding protein [Bacteroidales bacterium]|jgi:MinD superfamily P-loop ATPase|nr:ATP-binding protein [Bacteroidales bacterium]